MSEQPLLEFDISGMTCESCAEHVEHALAGVAGVQEASVPGGWESGKASVVAEREVAVEALSAAVQAAGYSATLKTRKLAGAPASPNGDGGHDFDLMVIGGGSAGFGAAIKGVELGYKVALVEGGAIGGTCVNVGCVPSKTLIRALETHHLAGTQRFNGVHTAAGHLNWPQVIDHKAELVGQLQQAKYWDVLSAYPDVTYIAGYARLTEDGAVEIDDQIYRPDKIVITTGASPWAPPIPGLAEAGYLDSTAALELRELPQSMIVLGANAVGLEIAQTYARAGTYVTVLELLP
ncbi:MAG: FAD-dependent oxidoreductase, partial [Anaerolineales bacterium]